jgi:hypothetical protein
LRYSRLFSDILSVLAAATVQATACANSSCPQTLEPVISDTSTVAWQIFERIQPVKVVDGYLCHKVGFGETKVDGDAAAPLFISPLRTPEGDTAANGTEMEFNRFAPDVRLSLP